MAQGAAAGGVSKHGPWVSINEFWYKLPATALSQEDVLRIRDLYQSAVIMTHLTAELLAAGKARVAP